MAANPSEQWEAMPVEDARGYVRTYFEKMGLEPNVNSQEYKSQWEKGKTDLEKEKIEFLFAVFQAANLSTIIDLTETYLGENTIDSDQMKKIKEEKMQWDEVKQSLCIDLFEKEK